MGVFNKTIIPLTLVGYEMIIANEACSASLPIYYLKRRDWLYETYLSICGLFWSVAQQKLEVDALSGKKTLRCLSQTSSFFAGSLLSSLI